MFSLIFGRMIPSVFMVICFCICASLCLCCCANIEKNGSVPALIAFGNSFVDAGNNNNIKTLIKANFPPYGKDFMGGIPTGRFTNGKMIADVFAERLGVKDYLPAYLDPSTQDNELPTGTSFGSGGSGYDPLTSKILNVVSLSSQLDLFKEYIGRLKRVVGEEEANNIIEKTVYLVSWSSNDLGLTYSVVLARRIQYDVPAYANLLVNMATNFTQELYKLGARKIAIIGAPPLGCLPLFRTFEGGVRRLCGEKMNERAQTFNSVLTRRIQTLSSTLPLSKIIYIDYYNVVLQIIENPQIYGIDVVDIGCCGAGLVETVVLCNQFSTTCPDDSKYLFWDSVHFTEKGYNAIADLALPELVAGLL